MRTVDTRTYVSALRKLVEEGQEVSVPISGGSMAPFLVHGRDTVCFASPNRPLKRGDIVFYQRRDGSFILHRILRVTAEGYDIVGDAQTVVEPHVKPEQIFALVTKAKRKGTWIGPGDFWWEFFRVIWLRLVPFRRKLIGLYARLRR